MFSWITKALRDSTYPERLAAYDEAHAQGALDRCFFEANVISQPEPVYLDADGYLDGFVGFYLPPKV